jgi:hypothetical protein
MLGHLVSNGHASSSDGYVRSAPQIAVWMRRVLGALFRRH